MDSIWNEMRFTHLTVKNRIARSATNDYMGNADGTVSEKQLQLYQELAHGGVGLIFTGHIAVDPLGRNDGNQNGLWSDDFVAGQRALVATAHAGDAKIIAQLSHAGAKAQAIGDRQPVAPRATTQLPGKPARALLAEEIVQVEDCFAAAAARAKAAGFDGVQLHCAHGYLFSQFLDPAINQREDAFGGSPANRFRIVAETLHKVKRAVGDEFPVFLKLNCNAAAGGITADDIGGMLERARLLGAEGAEISGYDFAAQKPEARLYYLAQAVHIRRKSGLPILLVGGAHSCEDLRTARAAGIDMISMARPFICQPDIPQRLQAGEPSRCIRCNACFGCYKRSGKRCIQHE